jgi:DNA polymerase
VAAVSGCLRGLFAAAPGWDLICSDFSAIEAVVLAELAGEEWRQEVFRTHGKIYEMSASKITGIPFEDFAKYKKETGQHHPMRKKVGKVAELASGYGGGLGAWKAFGADEFMTDDEIRDNVKAWREASPAVKAFWYGLQDAAFMAVQNPGHCYSYQAPRTAHGQPPAIIYGVKDDILYCRLPSGRNLTYHAPRLEPDTDYYGRPTLRLTYMGWNSDYKKGPIGWTRLDTWGGKLTENVVQAVSRDLLAFAMPPLERAGYPIVLHVHDEIVSEIPAGSGDVAEFEKIMSTVPAWAEGWPVKAAGGWRGKRYRKD